MNSELIVIIVCFAILAVIAFLTYRGSSSSDSFGGSSPRRKFRIEGRLSSGASKEETPYSRSERRLNRHFAAQKKRLP